MSRKAWFWIVLGVVSVIATVFAARFFSRAFPIVTLELRMDRAQALSAARTLADRHGWGPSDYRQAVAFDVDDTVKTFVEREGGGADAFRAMLRDDRYHAYTWRVRHFRPNETRETLVAFTPEGHPYGFRVKLPEAEPGPAIGADSAQALAEAAAVRDWGVDLSAFALVERSQVRRPGGRLDHTLVYERRGAALGEGRFRLALEVGGDRLTRLAHLLRVPEGFARRYENLRSVNNAIAAGATIVMFLLYVIGGCIVGVVVLWRRRAAIPGPAVAWGVALALGVTLTQVNAWPLQWMSYDTALSTSSFTWRNVMLWVLTFLADAGLVAVSLLAAEGLGRLAFPHHPQLWRSASRDAAGTRAITGRVAGGVLLTGIELGFVIGFYLIATRWWGWWVPAESDVNPNVLATYLPWLNAVALSAHAGFWEEALFRAVPLSCAALIGARTGHRAAWIAGAMVLQALVFGGAHAGYASVPAYSRPVELFLPSLLWGAVYLRYGLLPSVITHFLFDLVLFSIPLFTSTAASSRVDQVIVTVIGAIPVLIVVVARLRNPARKELPEDLRNAAFVPEPDAEPAPPEAVLAEPVVAARPAPRALLALGALGLIAWATLGSFRTDVPPLQIRRGVAIERARAALGDRPLPAADGWKALASTDAGDGEADLFVWRSFGRDTFRELLGRDLSGPRWSVRFARTRGDVAARAEDWRVELDATGAVRSVSHRLPQAQPGDSLPERTAQTLALAALVERLRADPTTMRQLGAESSRQPARLDWQFTFADTTPPRLRLGERRAMVELSGNEVTRARRYVFVPEDWQRQQRERQNQMVPMRIARVLAIASMVAIALALGIAGLGRGAIRWRELLGPFVLFAVIGVANSVMRWPMIESNLDTAQPWDLQVGVLSVTLVVVQLVIAAGLALIVAGSRHSPGVATAPGEAARSGIAAGAIAAGALVLCSRMAGDLWPDWPTLDSANTFLPPLAHGARVLYGAMARAVILLGGWAFLNAWSAGRPERTPVAIALAGAVGGLIAHPEGGETLGPWLLQWAVMTLVAGGLYLLVYRRAASAMVWTAGTLAILQSVRAVARGGHPDLMVGALIAIVLTVALAVLATRSLAATPQSRGDAAGG